MPDKMIEANVNGKNRPKHQNRLEALGDGAATHHELPDKTAPRLQGRVGQSKNGGARKGKNQNAAARKISKGRKRGRKSYPVVGFADVLLLADGIMKHNAGQPVKRVTLLKQWG